MVVTIEGPPSKCPECLCDFFLGKKECSGCGNKYEGWKRVRDCREKDKEGVN